MGQTGKMGGDSRWLGAGSPAASLLDPEGWLWCRSRLERAQPCPVSVSKGLRALSLPDTSPACGGHRRPLAPTAPYQGRSQTRALETP